jgi:hypothetical protein
MCDFLSAIITRNGKIFQHWATDHHSSLIDIFGLHEGAGAVVKDQNFIRVEFSPAKENDKKDFCDAAKYILYVDEEFTPDWFDSDMRANVDGFLREQVSRMIVRDSRKLLVGGCWIIAEGAHIETAMQCRLFIAGGTVQSVDSGGTVQSVDSGGTVNGIKQI